MDAPSRPAARGYLRVVSRHVRPGDVQDEISLPGPPGEPIRLVVTRTGVGLFHEIADVTRCVLDRMVIHMTRPHSVSQVTG